MNGVVTGYFNILLPVLMYFGWKMRSIQGVLKYQLVFYHTSAK